MGKAVQDTLFAYVYTSTLDYDEPTVILLSNGDAADAEWAALGPVVVHIEIPDNFDPRPGQVEALREQIETVRANAQLQITKLEGHIQKLLALEHSE